MKLIRMSIYILITLVYTGFSQIEQEIIWEKNFGGSRDDFINSIRTTDDKSFIFVGQTSSFDFDVSKNFGGFDVWLVEIDESGKIIRENTFGGTNDDIGYSFGFTNDNGLIICGMTLSIDGLISNNYGKADGLVIKTDRYGNIDWIKNYGGENIDILNSVIVTDDGYVFVGTSNSNTYDISDHKGQDDIWVIKTNTLGDIIWSKTYGGSKSDKGTAIIKSSDGDYVILAYSNSDDGDFKSFYGEYDIIVMKIDSLGDIIWSKNFGGSESDFASSIIEDIDGGFVISGYSYSSDGDLQENNGLSDIYVFKINHSGEILWSFNHGTSSEDIGKSVSKTQDGGYLIVGETSLFDFEDEDLFDSVILVIKLDSNGLFNWKKYLGGTSQDYALTGFELESNTFLIAGSSRSKTGYVSKNYGRFDIWIALLGTLSKVSAKDEYTFKLFPNPTQEYIQVEIPDEHHYKEYLIYDINGKLIKREPFTGEIGISDLARGSYYLLLYSPTRTGYGIFVKE